MAQVATPAGDNRRAQHQQGQHESRPESSAPLQCFLLTHWCSSSKRKKLRGSQAGNSDAGGGGVMGSIFRRLRAGPCCCACCCCNRKAVKCAQGRSMGKCVEGWAMLPDSQQAAGSTGGSRRRQRRQQARTCASGCGAASSVSAAAADALQLRTAGRGAALASLQEGPTSTLRQQPCKHIQCAQGNHSTFSITCLPCSCRRAAERKAACDICISTALPCV